MVRRSLTAHTSFRPVTILIVGTNHDVESEGFDRKNIDLPDATNRLIKEVLAVNTRTIGTSLSISRHHTPESMTD